MPPRCQRRLLTARVSLAAATLAAVAAPAAAGQLPASPADLAYRTALYDYHQGDYFSALSELAVAGQHGQLVGARPIFLTAASSIGFDMTKAATDALDQLAQPLQRDSVRNAICLHRCRGASDLPPPAAVNAAWFYLGKRHYGRQRWGDAAASFERSDTPLALNLRQERDALRVNLAIRAGDLAQAEAMLADPAPGDPWQAYSIYNLGTAYLQRQAPERGLFWLDQLIANPDGQAEQAALRDRAQLAAAWWMLGAKDYAGAESRFQRIRTSSPLVDQALLGYGLARFQSARYPQALVPWRYLSGRGAGNPAGQDALLAVASTYEKMGDAGRASAQYLLADKAFDGELQRLDALTAQIRRGDQLPDILSAQQHAPWWQSLVGIVSGPRFQSYLTKLDDLGRLRERLSEWRSRLARDRKALARIGALQQSSLDTDTARRFIEQLDALEAVPPARLRATASNQAAPRSDRPDAAAPGSKGAASTRPMRELDPGLAMRERFVVTLLQLPQPDAEAPPASYQARTAQLEARLQLQLHRLAQSESRTNAALRDLLLDELTRQQARLKQYQLHARVAAARLSVEAAR